MKEGLKTYEIELADEVRGGGAEVGAEGNEDEDGSRGEKFASLTLQIGLRN